MDSSLRRPDGDNRLRFGLDAIYKLEARATVNPMGRMPDSEFAYALADAPAAPRVSIGHLPASIPLEWGPQISAGRRSRKHQRMSDVETDGKNDQPGKLNPFGSLQDAAAIQANERTLLAWIRTGLSLITFGFVIARLGVWIRIIGDAGAGVPGSAWLGAVFVLMGAALDAIGITRYVRFHRAIMQRRPVPTNVTAVLAIAGAIAMLGALLGAFVILSLRAR
jgi:putative membrane protein